MYWTKGQDHTQCLVFSYTKFEDYQGCWVCASISLICTYMYKYGMTHFRTLVCFIIIAILAWFATVPDQSYSMPNWDKEKLVYSVYMYSRNYSLKLIVLAIPGCVCWAVSRGFVAGSSRSTLCPQLQIGHDSQHWPDLLLSVYCTPSAACPRSQSHRIKISNPQQKHSCVREF